jgi:Antp family protein
MVILELLYDRNFFILCLFRPQQARREREEQEKMKQESLKSSQQQQHHHNKHQQQAQEHAALLSQNSHGQGPHSGHLGNHGVGGLVGSHLHHPSLVQNELKLGLGGMGMGNLGMMGPLDNKNQDLLKAVSKVSS